ncbi:hypothetical protein ACFL6M_01440 [Candidatus Eisenbacteria bacterium]|uniref:Uncharacterized protein n=1 Tax=Eiseniibacteriota bacterium TaxID=2212470 RepID=A0ABV6YIR6_UNCEI
MFRTIAFFAACALILALGFCLGCSESSSGPETGNDPPPDSEVVAEESIGPDGGTLETDDFSMIVPAGAFDTTTDLVLHASSVDDNFGDNGATRAFRLTGFPPSCETAMEIRITYQGTLANQSHIAVGVMTEDPAVAPVPYKFFEAADSSGQLYCEIPALFPGTLKTKAGASSDPLDQIFISGVTDYKVLTSSGGHFKFRYPASQELWATTLDPHLETAYGLIGTMGYDFTGFVWPVEVQLRFVKAEQSALQRFQWAWSQHFGNDDHLLMLNLSDKDAADYNIMRIMAAKEFFHDVLSTYDAGYVIQEGGFPKMAADRYWFHAAVAAWAEHRFANDPDHEPLDFTNIYDGPGETLTKMMHHAPFRGLQAGSVGSVQGADRLAVAEAHGSGMSLLIKYLVGEYGESLLLNTYNDMRAQSRHPVASLLASINDPVSVWWPDFLRVRFLEEIYNFSEFLLFDACEQVIYALGSCWRIDSGNTRHSETRGYPELSAHAYWIDLTHSGDLDHKAGLRLAVDSPGAAGGDVSMQIFGYKGNMNESVRLEHATDEFLITNLLNFRANGYTRLRVLVFNNRHAGPTYTNVSNITFTVEVAEGVSPPPDFDYARVSLILTNARFNSDQGPYDDSVSHTMPSSDHVGGYLGLWSGDTWVAAWDTVVTDAYMYWGELRLTRDPVHNMITSISVKDSLYSFYFNDDRFVTSRIYAEDVEMSLEDEHMNYWIFELSNPELCISAPTIEYRSDDRVLGAWRELVNPRCDDGAWLRVTFGYKR